MQKEKNYLGYVLVDPNTNLPRYVGIKEDNYKGYKWERVTLNPSNSVDEPKKVNTELNQCETTIESTLNNGSKLSTIQANGIGNDGNSTLLN